MAMTKKELRKAETEQERDQVFTRLLLILGKPPRSMSIKAMEDYEQLCRKHIRAMKPKLDVEMVLWHYQCWCQQEAKKRG